MSSIAPKLPPTLCPHICVLPSPDVVQLLANAHVPALHDLLQHFSSVSQVTTRTTTLGSVIHDAFEIRVSDLETIETACREDPEARCSRLIDLIGSRISKNASDWVKQVEGLNLSQASDSPWWQEVRQCINSDKTPWQSEGWNHPVAVIFAVSTAAANPLQAMQTLVARRFQFPTWVDDNMIAHHLVIQSDNTQRSQDEAVALLNALRKLYGQSVHLLPLSSALQHSPSDITTGSSSEPSLPGPPLKILASSEHLNLSSEDTEAVTAFVRDFVVKHLIPWMERSVLEWSEIYMSAKRLPSRLFSSTRRLFASSTTAASPSKGLQQHTTSLAPTGLESISPLPRRRLSEFATMLGDVKLAISAWELLRKEGHGGSEVLPILLAPSRILPAHAAYALQQLNTLTTSPSSHIFALLYIVRWEFAVSGFLSREVEGERWLTWAASASDEVAAGLMFGQAAHLLHRAVASRSFRRTAIWCVEAANRLEKCGIKPIALYYLQQARCMNSMNLPKVLSPSFLWAEYFGKADAPQQAVLSGHIQHSLARLYFHMGNLHGALQMMMELFKPFKTLGIMAPGVAASNAMYLEDFVSMYNDLKCGPADDVLDTRTLNIQLCTPTEIAFAKEKEVIIPEGGLSPNHDSTWMDFCREKGFTLDSKASAFEAGVDVWAHIPLVNPFEFEITLADLKIRVVTADGSNVYVAAEEFVTLPPDGCTSVPFCLTMNDPCRIEIQEITFKLISVIECKQSLLISGRRLHDTSEHHQRAMYAPSYYPVIEIVSRELALRVMMEQEGPPIKIAGEIEHHTMRVINTGVQIISSLWLCATDGESVFVMDDSKSERPEIDDAQTLSAFQIANSSSWMSPQEVLLPVSEDGSRRLSPGEAFQTSIFTNSLGFSSEFRVTILFSSSEKRARCIEAAVVRGFPQQLCARAMAEPAPGGIIDYDLNVEIENMVGTDIMITQVATISPMWHCPPGTDLATLPQRVVRDQSLLLKYHCAFWPLGTGRETSVAFAKSIVNTWLKGNDLIRPGPPQIEVVHSVYQKTDPSEWYTTRLVVGRWRAAKRLQRGREWLLQESRHGRRLPLVHPREMDIIIHWRRHEKAGFLVLTGLALGAAHGELESTLSRIDEEDSKAAMFAESRQEWRLAASILRDTIWNDNMDPVTVTFEFNAHSEHDFRTGPAILPVTVWLKNYSFTKGCKYVMDLKHGDSVQKGEFLKPRIIGILTLTGEIDSATARQHELKLYFPRPGIYTFSTWRLETKAMQSLDDGHVCSAKHVQLPSESCIPIMSIANRQE